MVGKETWNGTKVENVVAVRDDGICLRSMDSKKVRICLYDEFMSYKAWKSFDIRKR